MSDSKRARAAGPRAWISGVLVGLLLGSPLAAQVAVDEPESATSRHQVTEGDTLFRVAERYLGDGDAWPKLWSYNPEITNPHWIYPGHVLRLRAGSEPGTGGATSTALVATAAPGSAPPRSLRPRSNVPPGTVLIGEEVYLDRDALAQSSRIVGSSEDHLMLSPTDEVYLQFKEKSAAPARGKELTVFVRQHRAEIAPKAGKVRSYHASEGGEVVRVLGALRVRDFDADKRIARAVVTEALEPIERGFEVADVPRRLTQVPPKKNARAVSAKILSATRALSTLGEGQVVFLDAGAKKGVEVGNRFVVVRQGDPWRQQLTLREDLTGAERPDPHALPAEAFPPEVVAELCVLYVRPESSTALITATEGELAPGERVEMRAGY